MDGGERLEGSANSTIRFRDFFTLPSSRGSVLEQIQNLALQLVDGQAAEQLWIKIGRLLGHYSA
jgi:hypothetical protein